MFQNGTLGGLLLAAGFWLTAAACVAAPRPGPDMPLGPSALPPAGYVDFCQRQPWDCGADPHQVLARVQQAQADRAALYAAASPPALQALAMSAPAAVVAPAALAVRTPAPLGAPASAMATVAPAPSLVHDDVVASAAPQAEAASAAPSTAPIPAAAPVATPGPARMTPQLWSRLNEINAEVNRAIIEATDLATYGKADYWATPLENGIRHGDCEDYVLEKLRALLAAGTPREDLNVAVVTTAWGETHAVLLVNTSDGEFVLDNLSPWVTSWQKTGYRWREREVDGDPFTWVMIQDPSRRHAPPATQLQTDHALVVAAAS